MIPCYSSASVLPQVAATPEFTYHFSTLLTTLTSNFIPSHLDVLTSRSPSFLLAAHLITRQQQFSGCAYTDQQHLSIRPQAALSVRFSRSLEFTPVGDRNWVKSGRGITHQDVVEIDQKYVVLENKHSQEELSLSHCAELKETHLAPLISGSSRSTSTSTVKAEDSSPAHDSPELSTIHSNTSTTSTTNNGIGTSLQGRLSCITH